MGAGIQRARARAAPGSRALMTRTGTGLPRSWPSSTGRACGSHKLPAHALRAGSGCGSEHNGGCLPALRRRHSPGNARRSGRMQGRRAGRRACSCSAPSRAAAAACARCRSAACACARASSPCSAAACACAARYSCETGTVASSATAACSSRSSLPRGRDRCVGARAAPALGDRGGPARELPGATCAGAHDAPIAGFHQESRRAPQGAQRRPGCHGGRRLALSGPISFCQAVKALVSSQLHA